MRIPDEYLDSYSGVGFSVSKTNSKIKYCGMFSKGKRQGKGIFSPVILKEFYLRIHLLILETLRMMFVKEKAKLYGKMKNVILDLIKTINVQGLVCSLGLMAMNIEETLKFYFYILFSLLG